LGGNLQNKGIKYYILILMYANHITEEVTVMCSLPEVCKIYTGEVMAVCKHVSFSKLLEFR